MPWTTLIEPCVGPALLRAVLDREGIPCRVMHLNLFLLEHLRASSYDSLARSFALNDFLFTGTLDGPVTPAQLRCLRPKVWELIREGMIDPHRFGGSEGMVEMLLHLRNEVLPAWLGAWARWIARQKANLVGFTCMFDQTIASVAMARMVRELAPHKLLALGGYAVRPPTAQMILRSSPWIDAVCAGEGEVTVVQLARAAAGEMRLADVPGIVLRSPGGEPVATAPSPKVDLDAIPTPNYDDFFADLRRLSRKYKVDVAPRNLPIENSRGCWWGSKSHCVFCGIREEDLAYRERDAAKAMEIMADLHRRYGVDYFRFTDYILANRYFETLLPFLASRGRPYRLSAEIKANITEERFALLARAGFEEVQPGIESFCSDALRKMRKGVSAMQNVHLLLLGRRFGVRILYNLLYGFSDDDAEEYRHMAAILPRLVHLDPPVTCVPVQITRYAPLQERPGDFGIEAATPEPSYELVFSKDYRRKTGFAIEDYCYYFERPFENSTALRKSYRQIHDTFRWWRAAHGRNASWLYGETSEAGDGITVHDKRSQEERVYPLGDAACCILKQCANPTAICDLQKDYLDPAGGRTVEGIVEELDRLGLIFREGERVISLVLPGSSHQKSVSKIAAGFPVRNP
jgi:ribosomal peptide maturation radical SAM protein 1